MHHRRNRARVAAFATAFTLICGSLSLSATVSADGSETLGAPSIVLAAGTDVIAGGVGLAEAQPANLSIDIPTGASVEQVIIYWEGLHSDDTVGFDDDIVIDGSLVEGTLIGGPDFFFGGPANRHWSSTYRADITGLGLVGTGTNILSVGGLTFDRNNDGAGILVIVDDGSGAAGIDIVDGNDTVFVNFPSPRDATVPQTLTFPSAAFDRVGEVAIFASSVAGQDRPGDRPNIILVTVDGVVTQFDNVLGSNNGGEWDTIELAVNIPAGVSEVTVELVSDDPADPDTGNLPASMVFNAASVKVPPVALAGLGDFVWFDDDADGIQDPLEAGVEGALVELLQGGVVIDDQTTPFGGGYFFADLVPGDYQVRFTPPAGTQLTLQDEGVDDSKDSDADPTTGLTPVVTLSPGELDITIDAGIIAAADPGIDIEKLTNGNQADGANDADVPQIAPGDPVTWTYVVTNTGDVAFDLADVIVSDDIVGSITNIVDQGDGDGVLGSGEVWIYEFTAVAGAQDLDIPDPGTVVVSGCNPTGNPVPGDRATYENIGSVSVPGGADSDPSHYCNPPDPGIDIEKLTNGNQADGANDADVPQIAPGDPVTWTYVVTNNGDVAFDLADVAVSDDIVGPVTNIVDQGDGDATLAPGEVWTYEFTAIAGAQDLANPDPGTVIVSGCNPGGNPVPGDRATYENIGTVAVPGDNDSDPSHYCNPDVADIHIEKFTKVIPTGGDGDLCVANKDAYGKPVRVTMRYNGGNAADTSTTQDPGKHVVSGDANGTDPVYIVASSRAGGGGDVYFSGTVNLGETFVIDATTGGDDRLGSATHVTVFTSQGGSVLQNVNFHTSCSAPLVLGEQFGSLILTTIEGVDGDTATLPDPDPSDIGQDADVPTGPEANIGDGIQWTYLVTNPGDVALFDVVVTDDNGTAGNTADDFTAAPVEDGGFNVGDDDADGLLDPGEQWVFRANGVAKLGQYANLGSVAGAPVNGAPDVTDTDPSHYFAQFDQDLCEAFRKPGLLTMLYTGDGPDATSNSQNSGKVVVTGDPNDASPVRIIVSNRSNGAGTQYFNGIVDLGSTFVIDGKSQKLGSATYVTIRTPGGALLQRIEFHTSCSQPLFLGDQFGAVRLVDYVDQDGNGPGGSQPGGANVIVDKVEFKDKEVKFKLKNEGNQSVTVTELELVWPNATNGNLRLVQAAGKDVFKPGPTVGSPYTVSGSDWFNVSKLEVKDGKSLEFKLKFVKSKKLSQNAADYSILVRFDDGTELIVDP